MAEQRFVNSVQQRSVQTLLVYFAARDGRGLKCDDIMQVREVAFRIFHVYVCFTVLTLYICGEVCHSATAARHSGN